jgi:hypothetical protein
MTAEKNADGSDKRYGPNGERFEKPGDVPSMLDIGGTGTNKPAVPSSGTSTGVNGTSTFTLDLQTCGLPGKPPCKIDESGTPTKAPDGIKLDEASINTQHNTNKSTISGTGDKGMFSSWSSAFIVPPVVACEPTVLHMAAPGVTNTDVGLDACGLVGDVRAIMAWLWALGGVWLCLGWIREAL